MIIATFGPDTGWAGKTITQVGDVFTLEGHGPISRYRRHGIRPADSPRVGQ